MLCFLFRQQPSLPWKCCSQHQIWRKPNTNVTSLKLTSSFSQNYSYYFLELFVNANVSGINHFVTMAFQAALCLMNDSLSSFIRWSSGRNEFTPTAESDIKVNPQAEKRENKNLVITDLFTNLAYKTSQSCCCHQKCHWGGWGVVKICGFLLLVLLLNRITGEMWWGVSQKASFAMEG